MGKAAGISLPTPGQKNAGKKFDPFEKSTKPKKCPFCGSREFNGPHYENDSGDKDIGSWWIECKSCPAGMEVESDRRQDLINAWNRRS